MTETPSGEQKSTDKTKETMQLSEAVRIVKAAIDAEEKRLEQIAEGTDQDPIMLEGETSAGYAVQMMVDPAKVARIMLDYWYPVYRVLEEDAPQEMWEALAKMVGLEEVGGVDI